MATPARAAILSNIATVLAAISTMGGYKSTVTTVERTVKDWTGVSAAQMPWLGFMPGKEQHEYLPGGVVRVTLPITVVGHVNTSTDATRSSVISNLLDDVYAALNLDTTRDTNAVMTTCKECETDEGDPDALPDSRGGSGSFVMNWEVVYDRTTGAS